MSMNTGTKNQFHYRRLSVVYQLKNALLINCKLQSTDNEKSPIIDAIPKSKKVASWASVYTDALFRQTRPPASLRNRLVGDIPKPRMIANFVVRLSVVSLRYSQSHIIKKQGKADPESIHFCPALLITTVTILSAAVWQLPALSSSHRRRIAPRSVWPSAAPAFPVLLLGSLCRLPFSERSAVRIPAEVL